MPDRPDIVILMTDEERAIPPYEAADVLAWRDRTLKARKWFDDHGVSFSRHYTGSLACVPSRPTIFTGHYPDLHGVTQTDGIGKTFDDSGMRWLRRGEVPTLGNWFRAAGYDTHYDGKWHISHADLTDPATGQSLATNDDDGVIDPAAVQRYLDADPLSPYGFSGWVGPEPHGALLANAGIRRDPLIADRVVAWLSDRYARRRAGDPDALRPFLWSPASSTRTTSCCSRHGCAAARSSRRRWIRRRCPPPPPPTRTCPPNRPRRSPSARPTTPATAPRPAINRTYERNAQRYRDLYYRLHAEVDAPIDRVRRAVTEGGSDNAVLVRTADHGDLLGAHGGLHQKWFNLYDEATRVPFVIARIGAARDEGPRRRRHRPHTSTWSRRCSAAAGVDVAAVAADPGRIVHRGARPAGAQPHAGRRRRAGRRHPRGLPDDPRQHARGRHRRLGPGPAPEAHGESACAAAHPGAGTHRRQLRRACRAGRRRGRPRRRPATCGSWCAPSTTRPPGPSPGSAISRQTVSAARRIAPARSTTSGSSTTSPTTRSKPTTGGTTPACTTCAAPADAPQASTGHVRARAQSALALRGPTAAVRAARPDAFCCRAFRPSPVRLIQRHCRSEQGKPSPVT